jgi:hypothetical protein
MFNDAQEAFISALEELPYVLEAYVDFHIDETRAAVTLVVGKISFDAIREVVEAVGEIRLEFMEDISFEYTILDTDDTPVLE